MAHAPRAAGEDGGVLRGVRRHRHAQLHVGRARIDDDLYETLPYADPVGAIGNACGLPAIALPCGFGKDHMPVGFQIVGAPFDEATLLDLGELYQKRTDFHRERPPLA